MDCVRLAAAFDWPIRRTSDALTRPQALKPIAQHYLGTKACTFAINSRGKNGLFKYASAFVL